MQVSMASVRNVWPPHNKAAVYIMLAAQVEAAGTKPQGPLIPSITRGVSFLCGAIDDCDQLIDLPFPFLLIPRSNCIGNAVTHVVLEHEALDTRQSCARSLNLGDDIDTISIVINHLYEPPDLPFDPGKPRAGILSSFRCHGLIIPHRGIICIPVGGILCSL